MRNLQQHQLALDRLGASAERHRKRLVRRRPEEFAFAKREMERATRAVMIGTGRKTGMEELSAHEWMCANTVERWKWMIGLKV